MKIRVIGEHLINSIIKESFIAISVHSTGRDAEEIERLTRLYKSKEGYKSLLTLSFDDIEEERSQLSGDLYATGITKAQAKMIAEFVNKNKDIDYIYCQCEAGISRSAGIAAAISHYKFGDDTEFYKKYHPNSRVRRMIREAFYEEEC